jgi:lambda repressor-like predicted transcriptional regulator
VVDDRIASDELHPPFDALVTAHRTKPHLSAARPHQDQQPTSAAREQAAGKPAARNSQADLLTNACLDRGLNKPAMVDLVRAYSNLSDQVEHLRVLLALPRAADRERRQRPPKQAQTRLDRGAVAQLVAAYQAGGRVKQLARQFGIHRLTVTNILQREGVTLRPRGIHPHDLPEAIRLYGDGWALIRLAVKFDVSPSTVTNTLRRAGVPIRRAGRPPPSM